MVHHAVFLNLCRLCCCIRQPDLEVDGIFLQDDVLRLLMYMNAGTIGFLLPVANLCVFSPYWFVVLSIVEVVSLSRFSRHCIIQ